MSARCKSCGAPIVWALTEDGKRMPVDAGPVADGNVALEGGHAFVYGKKGEQMHIGWNSGPLYKSHFATCPDAAQHRKVAT